MTKPDLLQTNRRESFETWRFRTLMNAYPMYFGTGGKILFWSGDSREVQLRLRRTAWTYNYVGTIFGGSMFAAADPFYMLMLLRNLGRDYVVWDKSATIRFRKPGRTTLYMRYLLTDDDLADIRADVLANGRTERTYTLQWIDKEGVVYAEIERLCYIADKKHHQQRTGDSQQVRLDR
jgi:acyl-coenzyme A thioesterase PaaI-like protein